MLTETQAAWLAGILEGEGCFSIRTDNAKVPTFRIWVSSTDKDVVETVARIVGSGSVRPKTDKRPNRKLVWEWCIQRRELVEPILHAIYPYMHKRRKEKIDRMLILISPLPALF